MPNMDQTGTTGSSGARNRFSLWRSSLTNPALWTLIREVSAVLRGCRTVLDVGCGSCSPLRFLEQVRLVGVDGYAPALEQAARLGTHDEYVLGDVREVGGLFKARHFDACVALDLIEHLPKEGGWRLVEQMESLAARRVVIFTPNGFVPQHSRDGDLQEHLSGWTAQEMREKGYRVVGMGGPKAWRGEYHRIKYRPRTFWALVSILTHYTHTHSRPEKSAAILCVKNLDH